ncbi:MAG: transposase [Myxococcales bacterium]|nr:transposase [Myxococcales bacterium]
MKRRTREEWTRIVGEVEQGGKPAEVARRYGVNPSTLRWWRTELRRKASTTRLLPVIVASEERRASASVEVVVGAFTVIVRDTSDVALAVELATRLRGAC